MYIVVLPRKPCGSLYLEDYRNGILKWTSVLSNALRFPSRRAAEASCWGLSSVIVTKIKEDDA